MKIILIFFSLLPVVHCAQALDCKAAHILSNEKQKIDAAYKFHIHNSKGVLTLDGKHYDGNKSSIISRQIFFDAEKVSKSGYYLTSRRIKKLPDEDIAPESLQLNYPDFFWDEENDIFLSIEKFGNAYSMSWTTDPLFICY